MLVSVGLTWILGEFSLVSISFGWFRRGWYGAGRSFPVSPASSRWFNGSPRSAGSRAILPRSLLIILPSTISIYMHIVNIRMAPHYVFLHRAGNPAGGAPYPTDYHGGRAKWAVMLLKTAKNLIRGAGRGRRQKTCPGSGASNDTAATRADKPTFARRGRQGRRRNTRYWPKPPPVPNRPGWPRATGTGRPKRDERKTSRTEPWQAPRCKPAGAIPSIECCQ